jgi:hypothetical protein
MHKRKKNSIKEGIESLEYLLNFAIYFSTGDSLCLKNIFIVHSMDFIFHLEHFFRDFHAKVFNTKVQDRTSCAFF